MLAPAFLAQEASSVLQDPSALAVGISPLLPNPHTSFCVAFASCFMQACVHPLCLKMCFMNCHERFLNEHHKICKLI